jgi:hypothetical protein
MTKDKPSAQEIAESNFWSALDQASAPSSDGLAAELASAIVNVIDTAREYGIYPNDAAAAFNTLLLDAPSDLVYSLRRIPS